MLHRSHPSPAFIQNLSPSPPPMTLPLPRKVGVPLAEAPLITSPPGCGSGGGGHESAGRTKPQLALGSPVSSSSSARPPQLYSASSPRSASRPGSLPIYSCFTSRPSRWKSRRAAMRVRISGPGPKGNMDRLEATVKEVTNWDGLSMVRTPHLFFRCN